MRKKSMKTKTTSDGQKNPEASVHNLQVQEDKADDKASEGPMNPSSIFLPLTKSIDEWWLTQKQDGVPSNKYTITSTGNGNVDISGK